MLLLVIVSLGILILVFMLGTLHYPMDQGQAQSLVGEVAAELPSQPSVASIFPHNLGLALLMLIPIVGPIFGAYSAYATGRVFAAAATIGASSYGETYFPLLFDRYVFGQAFFWLELLAYSIMVAQSVMITLTIVKARKAGLRVYKREGIDILALVVSGIILLFAAAVLEAIALGAV